VAVPASHRRPGGAWRSGGATGGTRSTWRDTTSPSTRAAELGSAPLPGAPGLVGGAHGGRTRQRRARVSVHARCGVRSTIGLEHRRGERSAHIRKCFAAPASQRAPVRPGSRRRRTFVRASSVFD
jgi:hypothetical protein